MALQLQLNLTSSSTATVIPADKCPRCGSRWLTVGSSKGPHSAELRCAGCDRFAGWMPASSHRQFCTGLSTAGALSC